MSAEVLYCGYSYHSHGFYTHYKHGLPSYLFRLQTEGFSEAVINGQALSLAQGDLLLLKPGDTYELRIREHQTESKGPVISSGDYYLGCVGVWVDEWWCRSGKSQKARIGLEEHLLSLWRQIIVEQRSHPPGDVNELSSYLLRSLCLYLERVVTDSVPSYGRSFIAFRMKRFVEENATMTFKVEEVARYAGLSVSRAVHLFKECFGKTIMEYALEIRLSAAIERMKYTSMTLEQIAESCGFGGYSYFHRVFKDRYGVSPGVHRNGSGLART